MKTLKHVGKLKNTGSKVLVVYRTLPGESDHALVVQTATLPDAMHNSIIELVETEQAQEAFEFAEILFIRHFPDGRPMLQALQAEGRLQKYPTDQVIMTPSSSSEINLDQLNVIIAEQKNCSVDDLCTFIKGAPKNYKSPPKKEQPQSTETPTAQSPEQGILTDQDLAKSYRSQADSMYKEAAKLRRMADELDPPKKKLTTKEEEVSV
jgi:hypothetical protein